MMESRIPTKATACVIRLMLVIPVRVKKKLVLYKLIDHQEPGGDPLDFSLHNIQSVLINFSSKEKGLVEDKYITIMLALINIVSKLVYQKPLESGLKQELIEAIKATSDDLTLKRVKLLHVLPYQTHNSLPLQELIIT